MANMPFTVILGYWFWYQWKAPIYNFPTVINTNLRYLLSQTVSKLRLIICQIFATNQRLPHFNTLAGAILCEYGHK